MSSVPREEAGGLGKDKERRGVEVHSLLKSSLDEDRTTTSSTILVSFSKSTLASVLDFSQCH